MRKTLYNLLAAAAVLLASSCGADVVGEYTNHQWQADAMTACPDLKNSRYFSGSV